MDKSCKLGWSKNFPFMEKNETNSLINYRIYERKFLIGIRLILL